MAANSFKKILLLHNEDIEYRKSSDDCWDYFIKLLCTLHPRLMHDLGQMKLALSIRTTRRRQLRLAFPSSS